MIVPWKIDPLATRNLSSSITQGKSLIKSIFCIILHALLYIHTFFSNTGTVNLYSVFPIKKFFVLLFLIKQKDTEEAIFKET